LHRRAVFIVLLLVTFLLQVTVAQEITIGSVKPDLVLVVTICIALYEGPSRGALFGFWGGLLEDIFTISILGVASFAKTIIGYFSGELKNRVISASVLWPMIIIFFFTILHELMKFVAWAIVGWDSHPAFNFATIAGIALYNMLITLVVYPIIRRLVEHEEEVVLFK
jgi:rod shape-determining protein MreD